MCNGGRSAYAKRVVAKQSPDDASLKLCMASRHATSAAAAREQRSARYFTPGPCADVLEVFDGVVRAIEARPYLTSAEMGAPMARKQGRRRKRAYRCLPLASPSGIGERVPTLAYAV